MIFLKFFLTSKVSFALDILRCSENSNVFFLSSTIVKHSYDIDLSPSHYVIVKGATTVCSISDVSLSLALENGIVLLVRRTYKKSRVFLNGKHIEEEIIFTENGLISEGLHQWAPDL
jgi:hypothetical protein